MKQNLRNELLSIHKKVDDAEKRFDASVDKMDPDRRRIREGPAKHKHSEGDERRMKG